MRIIAGQAGGITLLSPRDPAVRPTLDRVKESLFAAIEPLTGLVVVDLFAGAGSLGLEAGWGQPTSWLVPPDQVAANLAPSAKAFSQSAGNTVRWWSSFCSRRAASASATISE